ncbi:MAG: potassium channel family protein [Metamycoplasmataceae bacterium]
MNQEKTLRTKINDVRFYFFKLLFLKKTKDRKINYVFYLYNLFISLLPIFGMIPILISVIDPGSAAGGELNPFSQQVLNQYYLIIFSCSIILLFDYFFRLIFIDFWYQKKYWQSFRKNLFNLSFLYQLVSSLTIIVLTFVFGTFVKNGVHFSQDNFFNDNIAQVTLTILLVFNLIGFLPRFIFQKINPQKIKVLKKIIKGKRKTFITLVLILVLILIFFGFVIYKLETDYWTNWLAQNPGVDYPISNRIDNIWIAMWYSFITITTIGYGDYVPVFYGTKIVSILLSIIGISYYGLVGGILINLYSDYSKTRQDMIDSTNKIKEQQEYMTNLHNEIKKTMQEVLLEQNLITAIKETKIDSKKDEDLVQQKYPKEFILENLHFDQLNDVLKIGDSRLSNIIENYENIKMNYLVIEDEKEKAHSHTILLNITNKRIKKIIWERNPVLFIKQTESDNINKFFIFKKNDSKKIICELQILGQVTMNKNEAWKKWGNFSDLTKSEFRVNFMKEQTISVFFIENIIIYNDYLTIKNLGINKLPTNKNLFYLKKS